jgi:hypothetical protein
MTPGHLQLVTIASVEVRSVGGHGFVYTLNLAWERVSWTLAHRFELLPVSVKKQSLVTVFVALNEISW